MQLSFVSTRFAAAYDRVCSSVYLPALDRMKDVPVDDLLQLAQDAEKLSLDELRTLQRDRLRDRLSEARQFSPYWGESFDRFGLDVSAEDSLAELAKLPLLSKSDITENRDDLLAQRSDVVRMSAETSGSTGIAMNFIQDSHHYAWGLAASWRGRAWWRVNRGCRQMTLWARPLDKNSEVGKLSTSAKYRLRNSIHVNTFDEFTNERIGRLVETIRSFRPELIYGYGSSLAKIGRYLDSRGEYLEDVAPKIFEYTADHMYEEEIRTLARYGGAPVLSAYGAGEVPGIAQQCWAGNAHVSIDGAVVEFLRKDGKPAADGELADIIVTPLFERAMPIFRYKIGDMGARKSGTCRCGSSLPMMELKVGKAGDLISTSTVSEVSAHLLDYINIRLMREGVQGVRQFFVEQRDRDVFELRIVKDSPYEEGAAEKFVRYMKERLGPIDVSITFVDEIQSTASGKRRYFRKAPTCPN